MKLNPYDTRDAKLYLDFISDQTGRVQISEPVGFDSMKLRTAAASGRYSKESSFVEKALRFNQHTDKEVFDRLLLYQKIYGSNSKINFIVSTYSVDYIVGSLSFQGHKTDQISYFECLILQEIKTRIIKRRLSTKVNLFDNRDISLNPIDPVGTSNILLKSKPNFLKSVWERTNDSVLNTGASGNRSCFFNHVNQLPTDDISLSKNYFYELLDNDEFGLPPSQYGDVINFKSIEAKTNLTNIVVDYKVSFDVLFKVPSPQPAGEFVIKFYAFSSLDSDFVNDFGAATPIFTTPSINETDGSSQNGLHYSFSYSGTHDIEPVPNGRNIYTFFQIENTSIYDNALVLYPKESAIEIQTTSTGIDSIVKGVRLIDAQRKVIESVCGNTVVASMYDVGGEHYDNFIFNGNMARGFIDSPFPVSMKTLVNQLKEQNADYRTIGNETFIGGYADFYKNEDGGSFLTPPNTEMFITTNEDYQKNVFTFSYKKYETDKDEVNTKDVVHSKTQWSNPSELVLGEVSNEIEVVRDPLKMEFVRVRGTQTDPTTALSEDNDIFALDVIALPPNTERFLTDVMTHNINTDGNLQLAGSGTYNWSTLGFDVGGSFTIVSGANTGAYTVVSFDFTIIELQPIGTPNFSGQIFTEVRYFITTATLTNRTNEGFNQVIGLETGSDFSNLRYTPRNNMVNWEAFLNTLMLKNGVGIINNTEFINGGNVTTQYDGGTVITENADIEKDSIQPAILSDEVMNTTIIVSWQEYNTIKDATLDGKFIRVQDNLKAVRKIYPRDMTYDQNSSVLEIEVAEIRLESEYVTITSSDGLITINEVGYNAIGVGNLEWSSESGMFQLYDTRFVALINKTRYDYIEVNGTIYDTPQALAAAINALQ